MQHNKVIGLLAVLAMFAAGQALAADASVPESTPAPMACHDMKADTNKDGKISHDEFVAAQQKRSEEHFKKMDTNGDGFIDESERKAMHEQFKARRAERRAKPNPAN